MALWRWSGVSFFDFNIPSATMGHLRSGAEGWWAMKATIQSTLHPPYSQGIEWRNLDTMTCRQFSDGVSKLKEQVKRGVVADRHTLKSQPQSQKGTTKAKGVPCFFFLIPSIYSPGMETRRWGSGAFCQKDKVSTQLLRHNAWKLIRTTKGIPKVYAHCCAVNQRMVPIYYCGSQLEIRVFPLVMNKQLPSSLQTHYWYLLILSSVLSTCRHTTHRQLIALSAFVCALCWFTVISSSLSIIF